MRHLKSQEVRKNWRAVLASVENGETVIVLHYNRPVARLSPPLRATAHTYNDRTGASITIQGVPMAKAAAYPDMVPSADGHLADTGEWILNDRNGERFMQVTGPSLEEAIIAWAQKLGHHLGEVIVDPVYPVHPDAGPDDW